MALQISKITCHEEYYLCGRFHGFMKVYNLTYGCPVLKLKKKEKKRSPAYVTALLESLTALLDYLDLFSNIWYSVLTPLVMQLEIFMGAGHPCFLRPCIANFGGYAAILNTRLNNGKHWRIINQLYLTEVALGTQPPPPRLLRWVQFALSHC